MCEAITHLWGNAWEEFIPSSTTTSRCAGEVCSTKRSSPSTPNTQ